MAGTSRLFLLVLLFALGACGGGSDPGGGEDASCPAIGLPLLRTQLLDPPVPQVHIEVKFVTADSQAIKNLGITWAHFANINSGFDPSNGAANCGPDVGVGTSIVGGAVGQVAVMPVNQAGSLPMPMVRDVPVVLGAGAQAYTNLGGFGDYTIAALAREALVGLTSAPSGILVTPRLATSNEAINYLLTDDAGAAQFISEIQAIPNSRIVVVPPVTAMTNQSTTVLVPTETPTPADLTEPMKSEVTGLDPSIPFVEVGPALRMTASIPQAAVIQLDIEPDVEFVSAVPQTVFQLNGLVDSAAQVPIVRAGGLVSTLLINDGDTLILGGIRDNGSMVTTLGVPIFENMPLVGTFLRQHKQLSLDDPLLIVVTATILSNP